MSYKRNPTVQCWIKHILEGQYDENEKFFYTIFGNVKRIRIIATIIDKKEKLIESNEADMGLDEESNHNVRLDFDVDDGTGMIRAIVRNINPEEYKMFVKGDVADIVGRVTKFGDFVTLWIEIIKKVENPNLIILRDAEIVVKIKHGEIQEIPELTDLRDDIDEFSDEIDVVTLFENESKNHQRNDKKEQIFLIIEKYSSKGNGINFEKLKQKSKIPESELRSYLHDLILESRIYESENDIFEAF
ncbi:MAG: hypothetical protein ACFE9I_09565 [Candidatus Hermodarchaeota archaeon]